MLEKIKRNLAVVASLIIIIVFLFGILYRGATMYRDDFYIKDTYGDRSALNDFIIDGAIYDKYSYTTFTISKDGIERKFYPVRDEVEIDYGRQIIDGHVYDIYTGMEIAKGANTETKVTSSNSGGSNESTPYFEATTLTTADLLDVYIDIRKYKDMENSIIGGIDISVESARIHTGIQVPALGGNKFELEQQFHTQHVTNIHTNPIDVDDLNKFGIKSEGDSVIIGNEYYFTNIHNQNCIGYNSIYRVKKMTTDNIDSYNKVLIDEQPKYDQYYRNAGVGGEIEEIARIDISDGITQTIALEAIDDKLMLILLKNNKFVFQFYDTDGKILGEVKTDVAYQKDYMIHINQEDESSYIVVDVMSYDEQKQSSPSNVIAIKVTDESVEKVLDTSAYLGKENNADFHITNSKLAVKDNKLLVISCSKDQEYQKYIDEMSLQSSVPTIYTLTVYDFSQTALNKLYSGDLVTNIEEDYISNIQASEEEGGSVRVLFFNGMR